MILLNFFGQVRDQALAPEHLGHTPPWIMHVPVGILMVPTVAGGYLCLGGANSPWTRFLAPVFSHAKVAAVTPILREESSILLVFGVVALGIAIAYLRYGTGKVYAENSILVRAFYLDELIGVLCVKPALFLGHLFGRYVDVFVIDGIV